MPRRNDRVRSKNIKGRNPRRQRGEAPLPKPKTPTTRIALEDIVMPDGQCHLNKRKPKAMFATKEKAERALRQAQAKRAYTGSGHVEKRVYRCPPEGCGGWHLSSREQFDEHIRKVRFETYQAQRDERR